LNHASAIFNMFEECMAYVKVALRDNGIFKQNWSKNPTAWICAPHSNLDRVKGSFICFVVVLHLPYASILRVQAIREIKPLLVWEKSHV
jgi:hypothetical protein